MVGMAEGELCAPLCHCLVPNIDVIDIFESWFVFYPCFAPQ